MDKVQNYYTEIIRFTHMDNKLDPKFDYYLEFTTQDKFDGSHGCIFKHQGKTFYASRNVVLETEIGNNFMFRFKELVSQDEGIQNYINCYPDHILYGEYMKEEPKFYVFDIGKIHDNKVEMMNFPDIEKTLDEFNISYLPTQFHQTGSFHAEETKWRNYNLNVEGAVFKFYENGKMCKVLKVLNNNYFRNFPEKKTPKNPQVELWNTRKNAISSCLFNMSIGEDNKVLLKELIDKVVDDFMEDDFMGVVLKSFRNFVAKKIIDAYKNENVRKNIFGNVILITNKGRLI